MASQIVIGEPTTRLPVALKSLTPGDTFRLSDIPFETAISEGALYRVLADPTVKEGRVSVNSLDCKNIRHLDGDRLVFAHDIKIVVSP